MPDSCCAVGCSNRRVKGEPCPWHFYRIPFGTTKESLVLRQKWVAAMKRDNWTEVQIDNARICSAHFVTKERSHDPTHPDYVPSVFSFSEKASSSNTGSQSMCRYERLRNRKRSLPTIVESENESDYEGGDEGDIENDRIDDEGDEGNEGHETVPSDNDEDIEFKLSTDKESQTDISGQVVQTSIVMTSPGMYDKLEVNSEMLNFYTGLPNNQLFLFVLSLAKEKRLYKCLTLSYEDHLVLVLMKLKLGLLNTDLAYRFGVQLITVGRIYRSWITSLSEVLGFLIVWPDREALRKNLPECFKNFKNCVSIIDCSEIFIERPFNLQARAQTWSSYKHHNTIKYLISITPAGAVSLLSRGWGGKASDKEITLKSGFLDYLQHGDSVLADRGFTCADELATRGATLNIPHFTKGKNQMSGREVQASRRISNVRIHVERVIGRLKKFKILDTVIPITQVKLLDHIMVVISALVNLNKSVVS